MAIYKEQVKFYSRIARLLIKKAAQNERLFYKGVGFIS